MDGNITEDQSDEDGVETRKKNESQFEYAAARMQSVINQKGGLPGIIPKIGEQAFVKNRITKFAPAPTSQTEVQDVPEPEDAPEFENVTQLELNKLKLEKLRTRLIKIDSLDETKEANVETNQPSNSNGPPPQPQQRKPLIPLRTLKVTELQSAASSIPPSHSPLATTSSSPLPTSSLATPTSPPPQLPARLTSPPQIPSFPLSQQPPRATDSGSSDCEQLPNELNMMVILHGRVGVNTSLRNMPHSTKRFLTEQCLSAVTKKPIIKHPDFELGEVWMAGQSCVVKMKLTTDTLLVVAPPNRILARQSLSQLSVVQSFTDRPGTVVWVGTDNAGHRSAFVIYISDDTYLRMFLEHIRKYNAKK